MIPLSKFLSGFSKIIVYVCYNYVSSCVNNQCQHWCNADKIRSSSQPLFLLKNAVIAQWLVRLPSKQRMTVRFRSPAQFDEHIAQSGRAKALK